MVDRRHRRQELRSRSWAMDGLRTCAVLALAALSACGGGAGGATDQFCDEAADRTDAFREASGQVSPAIIGTLRELALEAPPELEDDFQTVTEASGEEQLDEALRNIEAFLAEECGLEVRR